MDISYNLDVRPANPLNVKEIQESLEKNGWITGKSHLYVVKDPRDKDKYILVDGNHRFEALTRLYEETRDTSYVSFPSVFILSFF